MTPRITKKTLLRYASGNTLAVSPSAPGTCPSILLYSDLEDENTTPRHELLYEKDRNIYKIRSYKTGYYHNMHDVEWSLKGEPLRFRHKYEDDHPLWGGLTLFFYISYSGGPMFKSIVDYYDIPVGVDGGAGGPRIGAVWWFDDKKGTSIAKLKVYLPKKYNYPLPVYRKELKRLIKYYHRDAYLLRLINDEPNIELKNAINTFKQLPTYIDVIELDESEPDD